MSDQFAIRSNVIIILAVLGLTACGNVGLEFVEQPLSITPFLAPAGEFIDVAWLSDDWLVVVYKSDPTDPGPGRELWRLKLNSTEIQKLRPPKNERFECRSTFFTSPVSVSHTEFYFERECTTTQGPHVDLLSFDVATDQSQLLRPYELPFGAGRYAVSPDKTQIVAASNTGIADRLYVLEDKAYRPLDLEMDRAGLPAWAPNGQFIVFFGRKQMSSKLGPDWATESDSLWRMPANCLSAADGCVGHIESILGNISSHRRVSLSPSSCWAAVDGDFNGYGSGIWLIELASKTVYRIVEGRYSLPTWSPSGQQLMVLSPPERVNGISYPDIRLGLYVIDLSDLVSQASC
jgi:Tol biopolymer transport system component